MSALCDIHITYKLDREVVLIWNGHCYRESYTCVRIGNFLYVLGNLSHVFPCFSCWSVNTKFIGSMLVCL